MRLELLKEPSRAFVHALLSDLPSRKRSKVEPKPIGPAEPEGGDKNEALHDLADQLINNLCSSHSLALIYRFLLRKYGAPVKARAEFERYLSGSWSNEWIAAARAALEEEQGWLPRPQQT